MKVCYVDESGNTAQDPCLIMVGILADAARLNRTRQEFSNIFDDVQSLFQDNLGELKGSKIIFGRDRWRKVDPKIRKKIVEYFCDWIHKRKHKLAIAAIDRAKFKNTIDDNAPAERRDEWLAAGLHIALQIQKTNQASKKNKGHTFLIFDDNKAKADKLSELLWRPPEWTDNYYEKKKKQEHFNQIIDTTFSIKSHHAGLIQVADLFALIIRRYVEIEDFAMPEQWRGEKSLLDGYIATLSGCLFPRSSRWPARTKSAAAKWYNAFAPASLKALG